jgi:hypothetical protein
MTAQKPAPVLGAVTPDAAAEASGLHALLERLVVAQEATAASLATLAELQRTAAEEAATQARMMSRVEDAIGDVARAVWNA